MIKNNMSTTEKEFNLLDSLIFLLKRKKIIVTITLSCVILTAIISLLLPSRYRAETRILTPQQGGAAGMAAQLAGQLAGGLTGLGGMMGINNQTDLYVGMLQSRSVLDNIVERFDLKKSYGVKTSEEARKKLKSRITTQSDPKSNIIVIAVEDRDPQKAADMANAFVEELKRQSNGLAVTEAAQRRLFFEEQLKDTKGALTRAEDGMKGFQEKTGAMHVEEQAKAVIKNIAQLRAEIAAKEVELRVMQSYATANNPDLQRTQEAVKGMKAELSKLELKGGNGSDPLMPAGRMPSVGTEYFRKLRDLKFNETLYELLLKQYEMAKIDEARDAVVVQVIDKAVVPEIRVSPKRANMIFIAAVLGFLFSLGTVLLIDYRNRILNDPENRERISELKQYADLDELQLGFVREWIVALALKIKKRAYDERTRA